MSFDHHAERRPQREISDQMKRLMEQCESPEQRALAERFKEQHNGTANREFPDGRLSGEDDGSLAFIVSSDPDTQVVKLDFAKPVTWVGMPPAQAVQLAQLLIRHARGISREPLTITLH